MSGAWKKYLYLSLIIIGLLVLVKTVWAFDISKGIVGNLPSTDCQNNGNCNFCDWIDLFIVLQKVILSLFGGLALFFMIWAGQGLITAGGNQEKIGQAKKLMTSTIFGVVIILVGYFLINILIGILVGNVGQESGGKIFSSNDPFSWAALPGCPKPGDAKYCVGRDYASCADGKICFGGTCQLSCEGKKGVCQANECDPATTVKDSGICTNNQNCCLPKI